MTNEEIKTIVAPLNEGGEKPSGISCWEISKDKKEYIAIHILGEGFFEKIAEKWVMTKTEEEFNAGI